MRLSYFSITEAALCTVVLPGPNSGARLCLAVRQGTKVRVRRAAYNARCELRDERNPKQTNDYSRASELLFSGIFALWAVFS
jgi:hypothetical protein